MRTCADMIILHNVDKNLIKMNDMPSQKMQFTVRKCCLGFGENANRSLICHTGVYKSPLVHLGINKNTQSASLDESIIVLQGPTRSPEIGNLRRSTRQRKRPFVPDDSVIVLSDSDCEPDVEIEGARSNCVTILEDDSPKGESQTAENVPLARRIAKAKRNLQKSSPRKAPNKSKVKTKTKINKTQLLEKKCLSPKLPSNSNMKVVLEMQLEDENTVPIDDVVKSNPQMKIVTVDGTTEIEIVMDVSSAKTSNSTVGVREGETSLDIGESSGNSCDANIGLLSQRLYSAIEQLMRKDSSKEIIEIPAPCTNVNADRSILRCLIRTEKQQCRIGQTKKTTPKKLPVKPCTKNSTEMENYYTKEIIGKEPGSLRVIVIDGCNIATGYTTCDVTNFCEKRLQLVIDYFTLKGHTVKVFVPQHVRCRQRQLLETLHRRGIVVFTPSRTIGGKRITSYDDRFILDYAMLCGGIVVSHDQYRDLYQENRKWKDIIENRLLVPTIIGESVIFPNDPLGRHGPSLEAFLRH